MKRVARGADGDTWRESELESIGGFGTGSGRPKESEGTGCGVGLSEVLGSEGEAGAGVGAGSLAGVGRVTARGLGVETATTVIGCGVGEETLADRAGCSWRKIVLRLAPKAMARARIATNSNFLAGGWDEVGLGGPRMRGRLGGSWSWALASKGSSVSKRAG